MGTEQSTLKKKGYILKRETENTAVATMGDDTFFIKKILLENTSINAEELISEIEVLKKTDHPHIVSSENSFKDENTYYVVMDYCQDRNLATKIKESVSKEQPLEESQVLSWIIEICMALKTIHEKNLLHHYLTPENTFFTEFGTVCLGYFGKIHENSNNIQSTANQSQTINYLAPEVFTEGTYDAKSDIWSVGCILYELCTQTPAFTAETPVKLMPKILGGPYPSLQDSTFSPELHELLNDILKKDPQSRPTASEILARPVIINCLIEKCKTTENELRTKLDKLRALADDLERVHNNTTIGSLAGGVIGAAGGITSIVGLILSPFTLGASLIVTGVGVGVGALGGMIAGGSNITKIVNQSSDRKAVQCIIKDSKEKVKAVCIWLQELVTSLQNINRSSADMPNTEDNQFNRENLLRLGSRAGRGLGGIAELVRLLQVMNIGRIVAQTSRAVRVAEVATGVLSGLFVAVDLFFIAMDAKEIHHIKQAKAAETRDAASSESMSETENYDFVTTSDKAMLVSSSLMQEQELSEAQAQSSQSTTIKSEIMKFVRSIRDGADNLQNVLDEFKRIISSIPSLADLRDEKEQGWRDMELM